jgi:hypothetical protein
MIDKQIEISVAEARDIMESLGETCPVYVSFDEETYTLTREQMTKISAALYLADCLIYDLKQNEI